jgi:uncharacterized membrane protein required for colicin V production
MIAAATQNIASGKTWLNWFDVALVLVILFGLWRGRKNGMTKECLPVCQWLVMIIGAAFGYQLLGDLLIQHGVIRTVFSKGINEKTAGYITSYLLIVIFVFVVFTFIKRAFKAKLEGSNAFGSSEYYFGMISGAIRYICMVIFALALLNAPYYSEYDIRDAKAFNNRWFGGGLSGYSGDFFPTTSELQISIFKDSLTGPFLKANFYNLLVNTVPPGGPPVKTPVISIGQ